jgi:hypothetical protein
MLTYADARAEALFKMNRVEDALQDAMMAWQRYTSRFYLYKES